MISCRHIQTGESLCNQHARSSALANQMRLRCGRDSVHPPINDAATCGPESLFNLLLSRGAPSTTSAVHWERRS
ncbi:hypothetical protein JOB18_001743 [Solea senegalensis]|uniref:Uncharacterized protein n=1 Tax=Solea senegalensis TaxID=28829 RepID=A0AAV6SRC6_SOLSE|nr:hypothetical protein JOB18_001743 [Solea senegalensis]